MNTNERWLLAGIFIFLTGIIVWAIYTPLPPYQERHVEVNGRDCIIVREQDGMKMAGNTYKDVAVCPK
jgi:hypothetical protein